MTSMLEKLSQIHKTNLLDQQLFCWRLFSKTEVVQNTDLNILTLWVLSPIFWFFRVIVNSDEGEE